MPIRFRCVYCNKLLGIATRKAGTVIQCPECGEKLIVPTPPEEKPSPEEAMENAAAEMMEQDPPRLFEHSDFEKLMHEEPAFRPIEPRSPEPSKPVKRPAPPAPAIMQAPAPAPIYEPMPQPGGFDVVTPQGYFVSSSRLTWLSVAMVILVVLAFTAGLLVGRSLLR
jgi:phage FluMu protein Com